MKRINLKFTFKIRNLNLRIASHGGVMYKSLSGRPWKDFIEIKHMRLVMVTANYFDLTVQKGKTIQFFNEV